MGSAKEEREGGGLGGRTRSVCSSTRFKVQEGNFGRAQLLVRLIAPGPRQDVLMGYRYANDWTGAELIFGADSRSFVLLFGMQGTTGRRDWQWML